MRIVAFILIVAAFALVMATSSHKPRCEEDEACWNCQTMGNKICGK
jgi:hypothetical protein